MNPKVVCIIQARLGSTRLPGKVLKPILGEPMLVWDVTRARRARLVDEIVIATTEHSQDDAIVDLCQSQGWLFWRGSEDDVLDRYYQAASTFQADIIVRITSDCPLIDPNVIDFAIASHRSSAPLVDYTSNATMRSYPRGLDVEVFNRDALERAWREDHSAWREHVTPYIYHHPEMFRLQTVQNPVDYSHHRWTVDTPEDLALIEKIYQHFGHGDFTWQGVLALLEQHPDWVEINAHIEQKKV
jgi:spore coat polysaccharide biosynthesis protein SpsF